MYGNKSIHEIDIPVNNGSTTIGRKFYEAHSLAPPMTTKIEVRQRRANMLNLLGSEHLEPGTCIHMTRLLFGALENVEDKRRLEGYAISTSVSSEFSFLSDYRLFDTLRFVYHARKGGFDKNRWGKALIDISRVSFSQLDYKDVQSIHRPFSSICRYKHILYLDSLLRVQHYLGSWESYQSRSDPRRSRSIFDEKSMINEGTSWDVLPWLNRFVNLVGMRNAEYLLKGVGGQAGYGKFFEDPFETSSINSRQDKSNTNCALLFYYGGHVSLEAFEEIIFPSIQMHILDKNPTCDIYVHLLVRYKGKENSRELGLNALSVLAKSQIRQYPLEENFTRPLFNLAIDGFLDAMKNIKNRFKNQELLTNRSSSVSSMRYDSGFWKWFSMEQVWQVMQNSEQAKNQTNHQGPYDVIGLFPLNARYADPVYLLSATKDEPQVLTMSSDFVDDTNKTTTFKSRMSKEGVVFGSRKQMEAWIFADRVDALNLFLNNSNLDQTSSFNQYLGQFLSRKDPGFAFKSRSDLCTHELISSKTTFVKNCKCNTLAAKYRDLTGMDLNHIYALDDF